MYPRISDFFNDLFGTDWTIPIFTFGFFLGLAVLSANLLLDRELKRLERSGQLPPIRPRKDGTARPAHALVGPITLLAGFFGVIGSRIFHLLEQPQDWPNDWTGLFEVSGLSIYGGLIIGGGAVIWYARSQRLSLVHLVDAAASALLLAYAIGRMGCQLSGDGDWGIDNPDPIPAALSWLPEWVWAYDYPHNVINAGSLIPGCEGEYCSALAVPVFPTPLYETAMSLVLFAFLWRSRKRFSRPGQVFFTYLLMAGTERLLIEQIRINEPLSFANLGLTQAEIISIVLLLAGAIGWWLSIRNPKTAP